MTRVLALLPEFPPRFGGMQTHAVHLCRGLVHAGIDLQVATVQAGDASEQEALQHWDGQFPCSIHRILSRLGYFHNFSRLHRLAHRFQPDLIYASNVFFGPLAQRLGLPLVARSVGNDVLRPWIAYPFRLGSRWVAQPWFERSLYGWYQRLQHPEWVERFCRRRRRELVRTSALLHTRILANSHFTASELMALGLPESRLDILPGGVDCRAFDRRHLPQAEARSLLGLPQQGPFLLCVCRLVPKKGLDVLMQVLPALAARWPSLRLLLVGEGPERARLQRLTQERGLDATVMFAGRIEHDQLPLWFRAADLLVMPSRETVHPVSGLRDVETMGRVICEAMAAGLPLVASRTGGIPSLVTDGDTGLLVAPDSPQALTAGIERLLLEPEHAQTLANRARAHAECRLDWRWIVARHLEIFASVPRCSTWNRPN